MSSDHFKPSSESGQVKPPAPAISSDVAAREDNLPPGGYAPASLGRITRRGIPLAALLAVVALSYFLWPARS